MFQQAPMSPIFDVRCVHRPNSNHYNGVLSRNTNLKSNPNPNANPINVYSFHKSEWHNERHNVPLIKWNVEIHLLFLPVFVAHRLKVRLPIFVATSYVDCCKRCTDTSDPGHFNTSAELSVRHIGTGAEVSRYFGTHGTKVSGHIGIHMLQILTGDTVIYKVEFQS